jgi:hypothetical protein
MMMWFLSGEALIFAFLKQPHQNGALPSKLSEVHFKRRLDVMTLVTGVSTTHSTKIPFVNQLILMLYLNFECD